jgi:hypothetical protein
MKIDFEKNTLKWALSHIKEARVTVVAKQSAAKTDSSPFLPAAEVSMRNLCLVVSVLV